MKLYYYELFSLLKVIDQIIVENKLQLPPFDWIFIRSWSVSWHSYFVHRLDIKWQK